MLAALPLHIMNNPTATLVDGMPERAPVAQVQKWEKPVEKPLQPELVPEYIPPKPKPAPVVVTGDCNSWKAAAGIPNTPATNKLINNESGCRPNAINPTSGACGIPQALPCGKMQCTLDAAGAVCQLRWMDNYVKSRYGGWDQALAAWYSRCGSPQGCWY